MPAFEAAVYDPLALRGYDTPPAPAKIDWLRRVVARGSNCINTTDLGYKFLELKPGLAAVRSEIHIVSLSVPKVPGLATSRGHHFLSLPSGDAQEVLPEDVVIDSTYLQFADANNVPYGTLPLVYVGTRETIVAKMQDSNFTKSSVVAGLYEAASLRALID